VEEEGVLLGKRKAFDPLHEEEVKIWEGIECGPKMGPISRGKGEKGGKKKEKCF
jgi:hypothetical protein